MRDEITSFDVLQVITPYLAHWDRFSWSSNAADSQSICRLRPRISESLAWHPCIEDIFIHPILSVCRFWAFQSNWCGIKCSLISNENLAKRRHTACTTARKTWPIMLFHWIPTNSNHTYIFTIEVATVLTLITEIEARNTWRTSHCRTWGTFGWFQLYVYLFVCVCVFVFSWTSMEMWVYSIVTLYMIVFVLVERTCRRDLKLSSSEESFHIILGHRSKVILLTCIFINIMKGRSYMSELICKCLTLTARFNGSNFRRCVDVG